MKEDNKWYSLEQEIITEIEKLGAVSKGINGYTTYRGINYLGSLGDYGHEYWTDQDWEEHRRYVEKLEATGELGKPVLVTMTLKDCKFFDEHPIDKPKTPSLSSYSFVMLDLSETYLTKPEALEKQFKYYLS